MNLNRAAEQLRNHLVRTFPQCSVECRVPSSSIPVTDTNDWSDDLVAMLTALPRACSPSVVRIDTGFSSLREGFSSLSSHSGGSYAFLSAAMTFPDPLAPDQLPFVQHASTPVRLLMQSIERLGGFVQLDTLGLATARISIMLPVVAEDLSSSSDFVSGSETILLVEDEEFVRNVTQEVLELSGYKVLVARDAQEAMTLADTHEGGIDLLLTDVVMPGMNGRQFAKRLRETEPTLKTIFMSGYTENLVLREDIERECSAFLQKPFTLELLSATVRDVLDSREPRSDTAASYCEATAPRE